MDKLLILNKIQEYYNFKKDIQFAEHLGIPAQNLSKWKLRNTYDAELIYTKCTDINPEWLLTGRGSMLKVDIKLDNKTVKRNLIPLYNDVATIGGSNGIVASPDSVSHTTEYIDAGDWFPGATEAIRHYGDSMVEYPSGCILALKKVEDIRLLLWGRNYCIETTEFRITKRLNKSKIVEHLVGYSSNIEVYPDGNLIHEPIEIPTETIRSIYQVLGCVTKEYSNGVVEVLRRKN